MKLVDSNLAWETEVPIFRHPLIIRQLAIAIGIPFGLVILVLGVTAGASDRIYFLYTLGIIGATMLLTVLLIFVLYGGKYAVGFVIDDIGVRCYTQKLQANRNRYLNGLTVILGLFAKKPSVAGAGILAASRQNVLLRWSRIKSVHYNSNSHTILVRGGYLDNIAVFCTAQNYAQVEKVIKEKIGGNT